MLLLYDDVISLFAWGHPNSNNSDVSRHIGLRFSTACTMCTHGMCAQVNGHLHSWFFRCTSRSFELTLGLLQVYFRFPFEFPSIANHFLSQMPKHIHLSIHMMLTPLRMLMFVMFEALLLKWKFPLRYSRVVFFTDRWLRRYVFVPLTSRDATECLCQPPYFWLNVVSVRFECNRKEKGDDRNAFMAIRN